MAEEEITRTGLRVGGWLPQPPVEPVRAPGPGPLRLPGDPAAGRPAPPPADPATPPPTVAPAPASALPTGPDERTAPPAASAVAAAPASAAGSWAGRLRDATGLGGPAAGPVTRVGAARARRRRRRLLWAGLAVASAALLVAYAGQGPGPDAPRPPVAVAAPAPPTATTPGPGLAATALAPATVAVTGDPAFPGGPLLTVEAEPVPSMVDLSALGGRDWIHWGLNGGDTVQRRAAGTGEISDLGGDRLNHDASGSAFSWSDGTPVARQEATRYGVFQRGAGRSFGVAVAGSGDLRTVRFFVGTFSAGARLELRLSTGGPVVGRDVPQLSGDHFVQFVIHFRAPRGGRLLVTWRAGAVDGGLNDGVAMQAMTVS